MENAVDRFPLFAAGDDYYVWDDFEGLERGREAAWSLTLARLCEVMNRDAEDENDDLWSPPDLFMCRFGSIMTIYAIKPADNVGSDVLVLICVETGGGVSAYPFELEAKRRLAQADYWR